MDFRLTPEQEHLREAARKFAQAELPALAKELEENNEPVPAAMMVRYAALGYLGINLPEQYVVLDHLLPLTGQKLSLLLEFLLELGFTSLCRFKVNSYAADYVLSFPVAGGLQLFDLCINLLDPGVRWRESRAQQCKFLPQLSYLDLIRA